jgi:hypothetical protein
MASIVPPLDFIPSLPGKGSDFATNQLTTQLDRLTETVSKAIQNANKLPKNCNCDDPRVQQVKEQLGSIQTQINTLQENVPKIQQTINQVTKLVNVAQGVKSAITIAQLSNPVTAPLFIAQQLMAIQDATIVNAISSLKQFSTLPQQLTSRMQSLTPQLLSVVQKVSSACNGNVDELSLPESITTEDLTSNYNDSVETEFYNELNVSNQDLQNRSQQIETLLQQQQNLLNSLLEAPSQVYQAAGPPDNSLGKYGDYYIDLTASNIYGPKLSDTDWGQPIN